MTERDGDSSVGSDYRESHLDKGGNYDRSLSERPMDAYMTRCEIAIVVPLVEKLYPGGVPRYLDFACGTGRITEHVARLATDSYGLDVSASMVEQARAKCPETTFLLEDATREPLDIEPVDLVTSFRFLGNAQQTLREEALHAIHDLLKPGGYFVFNNHRNPWSIHNLALSLRGDSLPIDLTWLGVRRLLTDAGLTLVRSWGVATWMVRYAQDRQEVFDGRLARLLEPISRLRPLGPISPDAVYLARRRD